MQGMNGQAEARRKEEEKPKYFEGVRVYENSFLADGQANTLPGIGITVYDGAYNERNKIPSSGRQVLMHEFGHILQDRFYGHAVYNYVMASSFYSTGKQTVTGWLSKLSPGYFTPYLHSTNWTEISASTLAYLYFGRPTYWDFKSFPIDLNSVSPDIIKQLTLKK